MERETFIVVRIETPDGACLRRVRVSGSIDGEELARLVNEELQRAQKLPTRRDVVYSSA